MPLRGFEFIKWLKDCTTQKRLSTKIKLSERGKRCPQSIQYTDKKEENILLIYKEIQKGAVAKSYMTNGLLIYGAIFVHFLIYYEAIAPL